MLLQYLNTHLTALEVFFERCYFFVRIRKSRFQMFKFYAASSAFTLIKRLDTESKAYSV